MFYKFNIEFSWVIIPPPSQHTEWLKGFLCAEVELNEYNEVGDYGGECRGYQRPVQLKVVPRTEGSLLLNPIYRIWSYQRPVQLKVVPRTEGSLLLNPIYRMPELPETCPAQSSSTHWRVPPSQAYIHYSMVRRHNYGLRMIIINEV